jgi:hypothetical protein
MGMVNATDAGISLESWADPDAVDPAEIDWDSSGPAEMDPTRRGEATGGAATRGGSAGIVVYLLGVRPWEAWEDDEPAALLARADAVEAREGQGETIEIARCRCCGGRPLKWSHYCCRCDRAGKDGRVKYAGLPVGSAMRPDWAGEDRPKYVPDRQGLKGGVGVA